MHVTTVPMEATRPLRQAVLRPHQTVDELGDQEPAAAVAIAAVADDGELLAVGLVGREGGEGSWRVRGMATEPEARGQGLGGAVLGALIDHAVSNGATRVWCHARVPAANLYRRAGFEPISDEFEKPDTGPHFVMEKQL
jgi:GNAT superfamily N-acetyltransferase